MSEWRQETKRIELCTSCLGTGLFQQPWDPKAEDCDKCAGSGRIEVKVMSRPYPLPTPPQGDEE